MEREFIIIENPSELGAGVRGPSVGPIAVRLEDMRRGARIYNKIPFESVGSRNEELSFPSRFTHAKYIDIIVEQNRILAEKVERELHKGQFPIIMSGDHSNAIGSISALQNAYPDKRIGVIWIDAHADLHTPHTSPSGNIHGMPLGAALGEGYSSDAINKPDSETLVYWNNLTHLGSHRIHPKIAPNDLVLIDIRDLEEQEWKDIEENHIKNFVPARLLNLEMAEVAKYTLDYLKGCDHIYLSFDVDSMDPSVSKGTGTSVENGLSLNQAKDLLFELLKSSKISLFEVTEINPLIDEENKMAKAVLSIFDHLFSF